MTLWNCKNVSFSLVEVTLALGIAAFCLIAVFGLMPIGVQTNRNAASQTAATNIISAVVADLRATPKTSTTSSQFAIQFGQSKDLYFNGTGGFVPDTPDANSRYHLNITFPSSPTGLPYADLKVTWPAAATAANASGSLEMFAAFDRR
jgi:uncharacterized protein (TIGR02598 family)